MKKIFVLIFALLVFTGCISGHDENLIGEWRWDADGAYCVVFNEDGTGGRGYDETWVAFTWETRGLDRLDIEVDRPRRNELRSERWTWEIDGDILNIVNHNVDNAQYRYVRDEAEQNAALVGEWHWNDSPSYEYIFNNDGTGTRGFPSENDAFTWTTSGDRLNIIRIAAPHGEIRGEMWFFEIDGDALILESFQEDGLVRAHTRK